MKMQMLVHIASFSWKTEIVYFNSFGVEHVPEKIKEFIGNKNIKANIFPEQACNSITCWYLCIGFTGSMQVKNGLTLPVCFLLIILKTMTVYFETFQRWKKVILLTKLTG